MTLTPRTALSRRWHTTTSRLLAVYGLVFSISVMVLFGATSWFVVGEMERQNDIVMKWQLIYLRSAPDGEVADIVQRRVEREYMHVAYYGLFDANGKRLAGDVTGVPAGMPADGTPVTLAGTLPVSTGGPVPVVRAIAERSANGEVFLVARDLTHILRIRDDLVKTLVFGGIFSLLVGVAGGLMFGMQQMRRVRTIRRATLSIAQGDLSQRLPMGGRDELDMLAHLVNHMLDEVERLMTEVKGACDGIAHDLRTPLAHVRTLLAHIDELARPHADPALLGMLARARAETDSLLERFRAMLRISEIGTLQRRGGFAELQPADLIRDVCELYEPLAESRSIALDVRIETVDTLHADRALLFEALSNLLDNAIKFTGEGGAVRVELRRAKGGTQIDIVDNGPGIPQAERHAVMERFYRGEATRHIAGSGLGLSMVSAVMRVHDFTLRIGAADPGTRVTIECWSRTLG